MSLGVKSHPQMPVSVSPSEVPVRVIHDGRTAVVLVSETDPSRAQDWEAWKNTAFWNTLQEKGIAVNAVVVVSPGTLPRLSNGNLDSTSLLADFPRRRAYLRGELEAWVVNRLCQVLYLAPSKFDASQDWARYGVDSAVALELVADLEDHLKIRLPQSFAECRTPGELASSATTRLLEGTHRLPWWRSPWVAVESL